MESHPISDSELLEAVYEAFAQSPAFNGIGLQRLAQMLDADPAGIENRLIAQIREGNIALEFESHSVNPHIKRLRDLPAEIQISKVKEEDARGICVYPSPKL